ncbi:WD repeat-containing protein 86-like [Mizuhopecten yessoensis]|uniref:WD repeat-containing protein 86 n=1 Tax=Mizuhopecten yessoensis TaxID=6573 RepID=A0A210QA14_MIZYE|nr:WD repeat-containing protein 86-like [Mizuhopecten yessoensis]OWF45567.1 WD repeat-containing protein 86 [Mizuhopecten yessoensis]
MGCGSSQEGANCRFNLITTFQGHSDGINCMALSDNGFILVTAGDDKTGKVWDARYGKGFRRMGELVGHTGYISCILIVGEYILTGSSDKTVRKWDVENNFQSIIVCKGHISLIHRMICTGDFIFTSSFDHTSRCFDFDTGECLRVFKGHKRATYPLVFIPTLDEDDEANEDNEEQSIDTSIGMLVTGSADGTARTWNCDTGRTIKIFKGHKGPITCMATDDSRTLLATGSVDTTVNIWKISSAALLKTCNGHTNTVVCLQLSGHLLYTGSSDGTVREWLYKFGECSAVMKGHTHTVSSVRVETLSEEDAAGHINTKRTVFTGCGDTLVRAYDPDTGRLLRSFSGHEKGITAIKVHRGMLYSASYDGTVKLWHAFQVPIEEPNNNGGTQQIRRSPDEGGRNSQRKKD